MSPLIAFIYPFFFVASDVRKLSVAVGNLVLRSDVAGGRDTSERKMSRRVKKRGEEGIKWKRTSINIPMEMKFWTAAS
jgi:hypothetical protein